MRFIWPLKTVWITRDFYYKSWLYIGGQHMALDFGAAEGTPILAAASGTVSDKGIEYYSGNYLGINHPEGWHTVYRHLVQPSPLGPGNSVTQGQIIGKVGNTGVSTGPHLHFDLWCRDKHSPEAIWKRNWWAHDPKLYLGQEDEMPLSNEDKEYLGGLMRGAAQAIGNGEMNTPMRAGDPTWKPPVTLNTVRKDVAAVKSKVEQTFNQVNIRTGLVLSGVLKALDELPQATAGALSDADKQAIAKAVANELGQRMQA